MFLWGFLFHWMSCPGTTRLLIYMLWLLEWMLLSDNNMTLDLKLRKDVHGHQIYLSHIAIDLRININHRHRDVIFAGTGEHYWSRGDHSCHYPRHSASHDNTREPWPLLRVWFPEHPPTHPPCRLSGFMLIGLLFFNDPLFICKVLVGGTDATAGAWRTCVDTAWCLCIRVCVYTYAHPDMWLCMQVICLHTSNTMPILCILMSSHHICFRMVVRLVKWHHAIGVRCNCPHLHTGQCQTPLIWWKRDGGVVLGLGLYVTGAQRRHGCVNNQCWFLAHTPPHAPLVIHYAADVWALAKGTTGRQAVHLVCVRSGDNAHAHSTLPNTTTATWDLMLDLYRNEVHFFFFFRNVSHYISYQGSRFLPFPRPLSPFLWPLFFPSLRDAVL